MQNRDTPSLIPLLFGLANEFAMDTPDWYAEAFVDRGPRGQEPQLHLVKRSPQHTECFAHTDTIQKPGSVSWQGFVDRPSTLGLVGRLAMAQHPIQALQQEWLLTNTLAPKDSDWGRVVAPHVAASHWWYAQACFFAIPAQIGHLPRVSDVLRALPKTCTHIADSFGHAWESLPPYRREQARMVVAIAPDLRGAESAHLRLCVLDKSRHAIAAALQYTTHARSFGLGLGTDYVPTPLWCGTLPHTA